ncbi:hypothetical protein [Campylobacter sp. MIT 97-5078]|uniref:hypothetical protein n=1 Tax=Campylobacter sp. MIT 97-5078 TaxID=1548153 RepID=UPI00051310D5|nr:hypothetical protein [Campylobacter sp. MIT 97-5078]KGI55832.1 hypothetical protein LR59_10170 [Campylobacter sp. MIT 97-5078]KGI56828.1 hypothetical protein LR59_04935 [Campylobacter sp. MIT 97-5078]TQR25606.1 hypothetical protein DMB91_07325 [Campylobacter sp. MIT 97-5078]
MAKTKKTIKMSETEFNFMLKEANLTKKGFLAIVDCHESNLYRWIRESEFPPYVKTILSWAIKAQKYKEIQTNEKNKDEIEIQINEKKIAKIEKLKAINTKLQDEIKGYKELQKLYVDLFM